MSIKINGKTIAGGYSSAQATESEFGITRLATDEEFAEGTSKNTTVTPYQISNKVAEVTDKCLTKQQITNCLLEVPQRIKLDLTDGVLTLKAGSEVIVPYGTEDLSSTYPVGSTFLNDNFTVYDTQYTEDTEGNGKFFVWAEIQSDIIVSAPYTNEPIFLYVYVADNSLSQANASAQCSGTVSSVTYGYWYDTTNNFVKRINDSAEAHSGESLPLVIVNASNGIWTSIDQVFNGMGYIGSTIWVDEGVKGLIPNSRNEDGSLRNVERLTSNLIVRTLTTQNGDILVGSNLDNAIGLYSVTGFVQDEINNINTNNHIIISKITASSGVITSFNPKQPFRAVDYKDLDTKVNKSGDTMTGVLNFKNASSDKIRMTQGDYTAILHQNGESLYFLLTNQGDQDGQFNDLRPFSIVLSDGRLRGNHTLSMPSNHYINLTFGASGSTYTAPANGYFVASGNAGSSSGYIDMRNTSAGSIGVLTHSTTTTHGLRTFVPAKKGDTIMINYPSSFGSSSKSLLFVYAEGSI